MGQWYVCDGLALSARMDYLATAQPETASPLLMPFTNLRH
jgi:hypothetical protein